MKYEMELTLVIRTDANDFNAHSIDKVVANNLTSLLGQFLIVLASVHKRIVSDVKTELRIPYDDDIPF